ACRGHTAVGRDLYGDQEHPADEGALHQPVRRRGEADPGGMERGRTARQKRVAVDAGITPAQVCWKAADAGRLSIDARASIPMLTSPRGWLFQDARRSRAGRTKSWR